MQSFFWNLPAGFLRFLDLSGPKPPLVLVHGLGAFSYAIDDHAASIAALLDARGLREVAVLGHSMGGAVAIALACTRPDLVAPLVLAEAPLDPTPGVVSGPTLAYSETDFARRGHADLVRLLVWQGDETYAGAFQTASPIAIHRTAGSLLAPRSPTPREMLLGLPMPHVSRFGSRSLADPDIQWPPEHGIPVRIVSGAGHDMMADRPDAFAAAVGAALVAGIRQAPCDPRCTQG